MNNIAIYPGTFDPVTNGHVDIIDRALKLFDKVIVAIADNEIKNPMFSIERRIQLVKKVLENREKVEIYGFNDLLIKFARKHQANIIIRGLRAVSDFEHEFQLAGMNRQLAPELETVFLTPSEQYTYISSSLVKEIASLGGDVSHFVDETIRQALNEGK